MKTKQVILKGFMKDGLYPINLQQLSTIPVNFLANKVSSNLWHARLGHPQARILTKLCLPSMDKQNVFCESCVLEKSTKLPFESRKSYATAFLHTLHSDVWGPAFVPSYDGNHFYLIIVDEYSRYIWFFPMNRKSDVAIIFPSFLKQMETQFDTHVKIFQSDGGGEFVNQSLQNLFKTDGIIHRISCLGTPEQNGLAERHHRHIVETRLTLLSHAFVPIKF
jgi:histone deacetylase 1/2